VGSAQTFPKFEFERYLIPVLAGLLLAVGKESLAGRGGTPIKFIENFIVGLIAAWLLGALWRALPESIKGYWRQSGALQLQFLLSLCVFAINLIPTNGQGVLHFADAVFYNNIGFVRNSVWLLDALRVLFCSLVGLLAIAIFQTVAPARMEKHQLESDMTASTVLTPSALIVLISGGVAYLAIYII